MFIDHVVRQLIHEFHFRNSSLLYIKNNQEIRHPQYYHAPLLETV